MIFSIFLFIGVILNFSIKNKILSFFLNLPGTIIHEFLHFSIGLILLAKPIHFSLIPKKNGNSYILGSVSFTNITFFNALPVSLAPLLIIYLIYFGYTFSIENNFAITEEILLAIVSGFILRSSKPSSQDLKVLMESKIGIIFYLSLIFLILANYKELEFIIKSKEVFFNEVYNYIYSFIQYSF